jgi:hypothetical protein
VSVLAAFVQVDADLLERIEADPSLAEQLFAAESPAGAFDPERMRGLITERGPRLLAGALDLHPALREQLEQRLGQTTEALRAGQGGDAVFELMKRHLGLRAGGPLEGKHETLSLDKAWHGVHFLLSGAMEPGESLPSQAVLGGSEIGEDFSGYGPARCFRPHEVAELAAALGGEAAEREAAERFDPRRMTELQIYPFGWSAGDREWVLDALRSLRSFYADAAAAGRAVLTCLV